MEAGIEHDERGTGADAWSSGQFIGHLWPSYWAQRYELATRNSAGFRRRLHCRGVHDGSHFALVLSHRRHEVGRPSPTDYGPARFPTIDRRPSGPDWPQDRARRLSRRSFLLAGLTYDARSEFRRRRPSFLQFGARQCTYPACQLASKPMNMRPLSFLIWVPAVALGLAAGWIGVNAFDEELSPEALRIVEAGTSNPDALHDDNGYVWMTSLAAPPGEDGLAFAKTKLAGFQRGESVQWTSDRLQLPAPALCRPEERACFPLSVDDARATEATLTGLGDVETRIQRMRNAPVFAEVLASASVSAPFADLRGVIYAQDVAFAKVRLAAAAEDWDRAIRLLEADAAFNRSVLANVQTVVARQVAGRAVGRNALLAAQFWKAYGAAIPDYQPRLVALAADLAPSVLSMQRSVDLETASLARDLTVSGRDSLHRLAGVGASQAGIRGEFEKLFFQPNATANLIVARVHAQRPALNGVTADFDAARTAKATAQPPANASWHHFITVRNPVGQYLADEAATDYSDYQASLHDIQALLRLVRARLSLPPSPSEQDWHRVLASGDVRDPYTEKVVAFDPALGQPAIAARRSPGWPKAMITATGGRLVGEMPAQ